MHLNEIRDWCLQQEGVSEELPFDEYTLAFKVYGKIFALMDIRWEEQTVNLKCNPERAIELRAEWEEVQPGYHMNKTHWNTVFFGGNMPRELLLDLLRNSYELVLNGIPKSKRISTK